MAFVLCDLSPVTFHLTTTLWSFSCSESPRRFGDAAAGGLMIVRVKKINQRRRKKNKEKKLKNLEQFKDFSLQPEVSIEISYLFIDH